MKIITTHLNADFDGLASMIAVQKLYPDAVMVFSGSQEKTVRRFINETLQYRYTFEKLKHIELHRVDTLIVVDTRQKTRIGDFAKCLDNPGISLHLYDHHPNNPDTMKGEVEHIALVGATTTLLCQILQKKDIPISQEEATIFGIGIYEDTGSLTHLTTTPDDLIAVAWLLEKGAQLDIISQFISHELTARQVTLLHKLSKSARSYMISGIKIVVIHLTLQKYEDDFSLIVSRFMVMENLNALFALVSMEGRLYLIARSRIPEVNAGKIARDFNGGGHATASSATVRGMTLIEAQEKLIRSFHRHVKPQAIAQEMLSSPVISIPENTTIREANDLLTRYNVTVLPVLPKAATKTTSKHPTVVLGSISRRVTEKAIHHNLGFCPVSDYMTTDIKVLPLHATLADIEELIIENRQRLIPIIHEQQLEGVITRTDLLNMLVNDPSHLPHNLDREPNQGIREQSKNVLQLMSETLDRDLIILLRTVGEVAETEGFKAYAVGGFVRDLLMKLKNLDLDIVVEGDGIVFAKQLIKKLGGRMKTHKRFITANVILPSGFKLDIATARLEYYEYPAALPTVELSSIKLDLYRRDFSINAMALQLNPGQFGTLIDFFNCQNDLKDRLIKVLHNLSFVEDPSRILRAIRFEKRLDFRISRHADRLIRGAVKMDLFGKATNPRLFTELQHIFAEENPVLAIKRIADFNLFQFLWPDLLPNLKIDRRFLHILRQAQSGISWFHLLYLEETIEPWRIYLLAIMARSRPKQLETFCERFQIRQRTCQELTTQKLTADDLGNRFYHHVPEKNSELRRMLAPLSNDGLLYLMAIARKKEIKQLVSLYVTSLRNIKPLLNGEDLKQLGYTPGETFRKIFSALRDAQLDNAVKSREDEEAFVLKQFPL
ncbi:CBS domain-containing protein [Desulfotalea psychrophila]|nr:CBS domain-containing protein [Desulfocapsa sp.]MBN4065485.1 CBS domain-containing protein [Desulfocapsa sp. AH-315-G09]MBN4071663.1 CBS domain-containing protein [Desulfotalea psychrophila]